MRLGARGEELIKSYEKLRLEAYMPTPADRPTIGWGHTSNVKAGDTCTLEQAQDFFEKDVERVELLMKQIKVKLTPSMWDALVSLVFNTGTLGNNIPLALREKDYFTAWAVFALWRKQGGNDLLGLARRRAKEMALFLEDGLVKGQ